MRAKVTVITCLLVLAAFSKANIIQDVVSSLETLSKIPQVQEVAKALILLDEKPLGDFENCAKMTINDLEKPTCEECEEGYMKY